MPRPYPPRTIPADTPASKGSSRKEPRRRRLAPVCDTGKFRNITEKKGVALDLPEALAVGQGLREVKGHPLLLRDIAELPGVPDQHGAGAVLSFRDDPFKAGVFQGMVLGGYRQAFLLGIGGGSLGDGPRFQDPVHLQAEVVMEAAGVMFLDHEDGFADTSRPPGEGSGCGENPVLRGNPLRSLLAWASFSGKGFCP